MNCPKCQKEMEVGCLNSGGYRLLWSEYCDRMDSLPMENDVVLHKFLRRKSMTTAWLCRDCRTMVVEYEEY